MIYQQQTSTGPGICRLAGILLLAACQVPSGHAGPLHAYRVRVHPDLTRLEVEARLDGPVRTLSARDRQAAEKLRNPHRCDDRRPLEVRHGRIRLDGTGDACVRYEYLLEGGLSGSAALGSAGIIDRVTSPAAWLWRPPSNGDSEYQVRFDLPAGVQASVPWEPLGGQIEHAYQFGPSPGGSDALTAFGAFDYRELEVPGGELRVSFLRSARPMDNDKIADWLRAAAGNVALAYGRFPNPAPQVIVVPVGARGGSPVPFGRVLRDGGEAVQFFVDADRPLNDFIDDWTATHEFAHLLLPYVSQKWISEGFASYYQNVLMARSGAYSERRAWQKLHEGFERGRKSAPETSPNRARMGGGGLMKVYWSGAAVALLADLSLRRQSGGRESLDSVLERLGACCLPSSRAWRGRELFERLDRLTSHPVFVELYRRYADRPGFPDLGAAYRELGIELRGERVRLVDDSPHAGIRRQIMSPR